MKRRALLAILAAAPIAAFAKDHRPGLPQAAIPRRPRARGSIIVRSRRLPRSITMSGTTGRIVRRPRPRRDRTALRARRVRARSVPDSLP